MPLSALLFDVDGTLIDSNPAHVQAFVRAFHEHGYAVAPDRIAPEIGKGGDHLVADILGKSADDKDGDAIRDAYREAFLEIVGQREWPLFPGARELFEELKKRGIRTAISTSAEKKSFEALQKSAGIDFQNYAEIITTSDDAKSSKPDPDIIIATAQKLGVSVAQCALLGDTPFDARAAVAGGVVSLGVESGGHAVQALREAGARAVWKDTSRVLAELDDVLRIASPLRVALTPQKQEELMRAALDEARQGMREGEAPIGAVIANGDGEIVARGHNRSNAQRDKIAHAEIEAFRDLAGKVPPDARDLILVSTLEPCVMCTGAAMEAAIDTILYGLRAPADQGSSRVEPPQSPDAKMPRLVGRVLAPESRALFQEWMKNPSNDAQIPFIKQLLELTQEDEK